MNNKSRICLADRIVHVFVKTVCKVYPHSLPSVTKLKKFLSRYFSSQLMSVFDVEKTCTLAIARDCPCHQINAFFMS